MKETNSLYKMMVTLGGNDLLDHWMVSLGIPKNVLRESSRRLLSHFFGALCESLALKHLKTTVIHPQTNGQAEMKNKTTVTRYRHCLLKKLDKWKTFVSLLTYACNNKDRRSTAVSELSLNFSGHQPEASTLHLSFANISELFCSISPRILRYHV